jgi:8-oxo-dGTP pyrophosphatase MutT (NUDIX family)
MLRPYSNFYWYPTTLVDYGTRSLVDETCSVRPTIHDLGEVAMIGRAVVRSLLGGPPTSGAVCLSVRADGKILLVKASYRRLWVLPGGFMEPGEDPIEAAQRELAEETGTTLRSAELLHSRFGKRHNNYLVAGPASADEPIVRSWEIAAAKWVEASELNSVNESLHSMTKRVLRYVPGGIESFAKRLAGEDPAH